MKKNIIAVLIAVAGLTSCQKNVQEIISSATSKTDQVIKKSEFVKYTIPKGDQYCDKSSYAPVKLQQLSFIVKFDSSAIYQTVSKNNQSDINKLYGFSDNNDAHHEYSARFGWRWSNNALRLFGYIYNKGVMSFKELGTVDIGSENTCSIKVSDNQYIFSLNGNETTMPRESTTTQAEGYRLYPYFGGDEVAPHDISIWIEELL
jgi:hypothetical protein